jgi:rhodanese-related sulfurtransferase
MMKTIFLIAALFVAFVVLRNFFTGAKAPLSEVHEKVKAGQAVLVDIREPSEYATGVAEPALLLPMSDLNGSREKWNPALAKHKDKEWFVYCRSGTRASMVVATLQKEGIRAKNAGGFSSWKSAGLPVKSP